MRKKKRFCIGPYLQELSNIGSQHSEDSVVSGFLTELKEHLPEHLQNVTGIDLCAGNSRGPN